MPVSLKSLSTTSVVVVDTETTAEVAAALMRQHHVGALVVMTEGDSGRVAGILTDRDLVLAVMAKGLDPAVFTVGDVMSAELVLATEDMDARDAVQLMRNKRLRRLVVVDDNDALVGILCMEDVLDLLVRELSDLTAAVLGARDREFEERG